MNGNWQDIILLTQFLTLELMNFGLKLLENIINIKLKFINT